MNRSQLLLADRRVLSQELPICGDHLAAEHLRLLTQEDLRQLLQAGTVRFVIAESGLPLRWVAGDECHAFWKLEVRPHLVADPSQPFDVFQFAEGYAYVASEWMSADAPEPIVLLEKHA